MVITGFRSYDTVTAQAALARDKAAAHAQEQAERREQLSKLEYRDIDEMEEARDKKLAELGIFEMPDKENDVNRGIGPALLSSLIAFSKEKELVQAAKDLAEVLTVHDDEDYQPLLGGSSTKTSKKDIAQNQSNKPFDGLKVVFTGSLSSMDLTRTEALKLAKSMGAKSTPSSISSATDIVVIGEKGGGKKVDAAKKYGTRILELDDFMEIVRDFQKQE